ncbi:MAG: hypothetical protein O2945_06005 [Planctomycetota bacterium]|nr:hypothetical protein [Planctomycetota bacterium]
MSIRSVSVLIAAGVVFTLAHSQPSGLLAFEGATSETAVSETAVRQAIQKSLPYIEEKGIYWIEKKKCVSCHRVSFMTWSLSAAARRGFDVDLARVNDWIDWSIEQGIPKPEGDKPVVTKNADGLSQQLIARAEYPSGETRTEAWNKYVDLISAEQSADGSWKPAGQLPGQKRKLDETADVSAAWHALALTRELASETDSARKGKLASTVNAATKSFDARKEAASTEWYVVQLLLALETSDESAVDVATKELVTLQKSDGSWGWLKSDPGDALATGMAVYALERSTSAATLTDEAVQSGIKFLVGTQRDDGSWAVKGTKEKKKANIEETAVYWGTTWAAIALLETLPAAQ